MAYTLKELQDKENFISLPVKTIYKIEVKEKFKSDSELFKLLKINKVHDRHLIGSISRDSIDDLMDIIDINRSFFEDTIIVAYEYYYKGIFSDKIFFGYKLFEKIDLSIENPIYTSDINKLQNALKSYKIISYPHCNLSTNFDKRKSIEFQILSIKKNLDYKISLKTSDIKNMTIRQLYLCNIADSYIEETYNKKSIT